MDEVKIKLMSWSKKRVLGKGYQEVALPAGTFSVSTLGSNADVGRFKVNKIEQVSLIGDHVTVFVEMDEPEAVEVREPGLEPAKQGLDSVEIPSGPTDFGLGTQICNDPVSQADGFAAATWDITKPQGIELRREPGLDFPEGF